MICFAGSHRFGTSSFARSTFGVSNSTATIESMPSCYTSASSSTSTGSPPNQGGARRFRDFVRDGLPGLFENFVFNFYRHELPADWHVSSPVLQWQFVAANADALALMPRMETDVCLRGPGRAIILDTKVLRACAQGRRLRDSPSSHPANLYQLFTYLRQQSCEPGWEQAEGVLLYPRTTRDFAVEFTTHGHRIRAPSLDLAQPWQNIHVALMQIVAAGPALTPVLHSFSPATV